MEHIHGVIIDPLEESTLIQRIAKIISYFETLRSTIPGSLGGGYTRGLLFSDAEDLRFESTNTLQAWFNSRLHAHQSQLSLRNFELVLCHLDIAPRNIIWQDDGSVCLLDWASAGFYPRIFEFCAQSIVEGRGKSI